MTRRTEPAWHGNVDGDSHTTFRADPEPAHKLRVGFASGVVQFRPPSGVINLRGCCACPTDPTRPGREACCGRAVLAGFHSFVQVPADRVIHGAVAKGVGADGGADGGAVLD